MIYWGLLTVYAKKAFFLELFLKGRKIIYP